MSDNKLETNKLLTLHKQEGPVFDIELSFEVKDNRPIESGDLYIEEETIGDQTIKYILLAILPPKELSSKINFGELGFSYPSKNNNYDEDASMIALRLCVLRSDQQPEFPRTENYEHQMRDERTYGDGNPRKEVVQVTTFGTHKRKLFDSTIDIQSLNLDKDNLSIFSSQAHAASEYLLQMLTQTDETKVLLDDPRLKQINKLNENLANILTSNIAI